MQSFDRSPKCAAGNALVRGSCLLAAFYLLLFGAVEAQSGSDVSDNSGVLSVGLLLPNNSGEAKDLLHGAELGVKQANQLCGARIRLITRTQTSQWGTEGNAAAALALDDEVQAIITPSSGAAAHQILQICGRTRIPVASLCADASVTEAGVPWAVRLVPRTDEEARAILIALRQRAANADSLHWRAVVPTDRAGREVTRDLRNAARSALAELFDLFPLPASPSGRDQLAAKLTADKPGAILLWIDPAEAGQMALKLRECGFNGLLAGPSRLWSGAFVANAQSAAEGVLIAAPPINRPFPAHLDPVPCIDMEVVMAKDAVLFLAQLLRASSLRPTIQFPLDTQATGTLETFKFDAHGNRMLRLELRVCKSGQFVPFP